MENYVLGVDIGSGSVKLTLLSREGRIAATAGKEYPTHYPKTGWCEQDPEDWCRAFRGALAEILEKTGIPPEAIQGLSFDAATHTAVLLDDQMRLIRPAILWTDQRSREGVAFLEREHGDLIRRQTKNAPTTVWTLPQLLWLRKWEQEAFGRIRYVLFAKDYLRWRLNGVLETDTIDAAGSMFFDVGRQNWSEELCALGGIDRAWLPALRDPRQETAGVSRQAAAEFGLAAGTRIFVGTTDTVMEVFAAGNVAPGHATVKLATAGRICVVTDRPVESPFVFNYRHVVPGLWYPGTATASCAASYRWYRDTLGRADYESLNAPAALVPAGSDSLLFHPYLNGELTPYNDPLLRGGYTGLSTQHTAAHFTRATLEGVAFSLRDSLNTLNGLGVSMDRVRIIGGGAKGLLWRQIVADVLELTMEKVKVDDSSFGTAMLAAVGMGWFEDFAQAAERCVQVESRSEPDPKNIPVYRETFRRYKRTAEVLEALAKGTL